MKFTGLLFIAATALSVASCGGSKEEEKVEKVTFSLDTETSSLKWKGSKSADYFHVGSIKFTEGSVEMEGENLVSGSFKIDMNSITPEDATLPDEKKAYLAGHLKDTAFFFIAENPEVTVTVNGFENGKLATVINVRGVELKQEIPVKISSTETEVKIAGKFDVDFAELKMAGMEKDPKTGEQISSKIAFDLNLTLKK